MLRESADESFCRTVPPLFDFKNLPPLPAGYVYDHETVTALTLKNVEPHTDSWVGRNPLVNGDDGPPSRRAVFWVLDCPRHKVMHLQCGNFSTRMLRGHWVIFSDEIMHSVISDCRWYGVAMQIALQSELGIKANESELELELEL